MTHTPDAETARAGVWTGLLRGARGRCPNCGEGRLFRAYLQVAPTCAVCGHDNAQYPADDAPPYFTILIVGHLVIAPGLALKFILTWPIEWLLATIIPALAVLTLALLPVVKGAVIGVLWSTRGPKPRPSIESPKARMPSQA